MTDDEAVAELKARCGDLQSGIERATTKLQEALLRGEHTLTLRVRLDDLAKELAAAQSQFQAEVQRLVDVREVRLAAEAGDYVKGVAHKLKVMLGRLAPPPPPSAGVY